MQADDLTTVTTAAGLAPMSSSVPRSHTGASRVSGMTGLSRSVSMRGGGSEQGAYAAAAAAAAAAATNRARVMYYVDIPSAHLPSEHDPSKRAHTLYLLGVTSQTLPPGKRIISW
jgi:hypothetical protein|eukprot:COSAG01_NODE_7962_length_2973_cov_7.643826_3_plen_115_part_00